MRCLVEHACKWPSVSMALVSPGGIQEDCCGYPKGLHFVLCCRQAAVKLDIYSHTADEDACYMCSSCCWGYLMADMYMLASLSSVSKAM